MSTFPRLSLIFFGLSCAAATGDVFDSLTFARFAGSGTDSIQGLATDAQGNVYIAGTTTSPDLILKNAGQPAINDSTILRSVDGGVNWTKLASPGITAPLTVEPHPRLPSVLFAGTGQGIYKSTDAGASWHLVFALNPAPQPGIRSIAIDPGHPERIYALGAPNGILVSGDGGEHWDLRDGPSGSERIIADPTGSGALLVDNLLSRDQGGTWILLPTPPIYSFVSATIFDPHRQGGFYLATAAGVSGSFYYSSDWGAHWTQRGAPPYGLGSLLADPERPNVVYAAGFGPFLRSEDGGATWVQSTSDFTVYSRRRLAFLSRTCPFGGGLAGVAIGLIAVNSPDFGTTWRGGSIRWVADVAAGAGCAVYAAHPLAEDAFVAKVAPTGEVLWSTYLGGQAADYAKSIAVDASGNVYVAGRTASSDFPAALPPFPGQVRTFGPAFVSKFDGDGRLLWSRFLGGEANEDVGGLALDAQGNPLIAGFTNSAQFPVTPGAYQTTYGRGFVTKLSPDGSLIYSTFFGDAQTGDRSAIAVDADGGAWTTGGGLIARFDASGSHLTYLDSTSALHEATLVAADARGGVYLSGSTEALDFPVTPGAFASPLQPRWCPTPDPFSSSPPAVTFVARLNAADGRPIYAATLGGECPSSPVAITLDPRDRVLISFGTTSNAFSLQQPIAGPGVGATNSASWGVTQLSADGSSLEFSSYLKGSANPGPAVAYAPEGSLYASIAPATVLRIPPVQPRSTVINAVAQSFSGASSGVAPGSLVSIEGMGLGPLDAIDLGINSSTPLPFELGGTQVLFDDLPAAILRTSHGQVVCVAPAGIADAATVRVSYQGSESNRVIIATRPMIPEMLPSIFPNADPDAEAVPANARNEDGSLNDAGHPAAPGSSVTVYASGLGLTAGGRPLGPIYDSWSGYSEVRDLGTMDGFVSALLYLQVKVPSFVRDGSVKTLPLRISSKVPSMRGVVSPIWLQSPPVLVYVK